MSRTSNARRARRAAADVAGQRAARLAAEAAERAEAERLAAAWAATPPEVRYRRGEVRAALRGDASPAQVEAVIAALLEHDATALVAARRAAREGRWGAGSVIHLERARAARDPEHAYNLIARALRGAPGGGELMARVLLESEEWQAICTACDRETDRDDNALLPEGVCAACAIGVGS